jgi:hypothetical protein
MNLTHSKRISMFLLLAATFVVIPTYAEQFNLTIPVKLDHLMPTVKAIKVECRVYQAKPADWMGMTGLVAAWSQDFPVDANGNVNQTVQAKFDANPAANPQDGKYYQCDFRLLVGQYYLWPDPVSAQDVTKPKPGTPFLAKQEGFFPTR